MWLYIILASYPYYEIRKRPIHISCALYIHRYIYIYAAVRLSGIITRIGTLWVRWHSPSCGTQYGILFRGLLSVEWLDECALYNAHMHSQTSRRTNTRIHCSALYVDTLIVTVTVNGQCCWNRLWYRLAKSCIRLNCPHHLRLDNFK